MNSKMIVFMFDINSDLIFWVYNVMNNQSLLSDFHLLYLQISVVKIVCVSKTEK